MLEDLRENVQASENELKDGLKKLQALEIDGELKKQSLWIFGDIWYKSHFMWLVKDDSLQFFCHFIHQFTYILIYKIFILPMMFF